MTETTQTSRLHAFLVFNAIPPAEEGGDPVVYWFYSPQNKDANFKLNITGLLITFISFCEKWGTPDKCDYIDTHDHEIGLLNLCGPVWIAVSLESTGTNKRTLLQSILKYSKLMFSHFFVPIPSPGSNQPEPPLDDVVDNINEAFRYIVDSINWECLDITNLYDSYQEQPIRKFDKNYNEYSHEETYEELDSICNDILTQKPVLFDNVLILHSGHTVIKSTFKDSNVTRALSFGMRKKFKFMYLHNPVCEKDFSWLLGLYKDANGLTSVFQRPIFYDGTMHNFVAFKYHKYKIVLTLPVITLSENVFQKMPERLKDLRNFLKQSYPQKVPSSYFPYTRATNDFLQQKLVCMSDQFMTIHHLSVNDSWINLHEKAKSYARNSMIVIPGTNDFKLMCYHKERAARQLEDGEIIPEVKEEKLVALQKELPGITDYVLHCNIIARLGNKDKKNDEKCILI